MKILLKKDIQKLGKTGEVVDVANGYARNYLLPKKFATTVTRGNIEQFKFQRIKNEEKQKEETKKEAPKAAEPKKEEPKKEEPKKK